MPGPTDDRRPTSWTARVLAPLVLVVVAAALALVISGSLSSDEQSTDKGAKEPTASTNCSGDNPDAIKDGYYVVAEGDNFTTIAEKTCVPEDRLLRLNPNLDPFGLQVQNCVDLVADGCKKLAGG